MSSVLAETLAVDALRAYLLMALPAKVASINAARAAVLKAPVAGPYTVVGNIRLGSTREGESSVTLTTGSRTAAQVAAEIVLAGLTAAADTQGRLVITATSAPVAGTPSVVSLGADSGSGQNAAFGWNAGGTSVIRSAVEAPGLEQIHDGEPAVNEFGDGFLIVIGARSTAPRSDNTRDDCHVVTLNLEVLTALPDENVASAKEFTGAAVRSIREVLLESADGRTLGQTVHLVRIPTIQYEPRTFRFDGSSPLYSSATVQVAITIFERN